MERIEGIALRTQNPADRIALRGVRVHARLAGMSQRTTVEQTFVNLERRAIEAVYTFPLPEGAAVCAFEVITGERVLTGTIDENDAAIEKYEDAIEGGHSAFLMEQERPDVFTVRVGNLKPRQAATIRLTYVCALERVDRQIRVAFPTTIAPRYTTATGSDPLEAMVDGEALNPPHAMFVPYGLSITVDIDLGRQLDNVYSPSHAIRVDRSPETGRSTVTFAAGVSEMNRDVVLSLDLAREHEPSVQVEQGSSSPDGAAYLAVTFVPEFDESQLAEPAPSETVFFLDCSGSMQGSSIAQAVVSLELCLRSLSPGDTFNVCRFGSAFELMSSEPVPYSQDTLDRAIQYVRDSRDLGGTELYQPLEAIFKVKPRPGRARQVVLLTDGQVTNEPAVIQLARQHRAFNRIFTFGIGPACSAHLVNGLARATGGAAEFITAGERIDEKVLRTFSRLASPVVSDVTIDWDGRDVQTLAELPPVFDGDVLTVFGRCPGRLPTKVTLSCNTPAGPRNWAVAVGQPTDFGGAIATMWARRTIQSLEEVNGVGTRVKKAAKTREQEMLVSLSKQFGLLCSLTTFIAVEHRTLAERNEGRPALRRVPAQLAEGWGDVAACPPMPAVAAPFPASPTRGLAGRARGFFGGMKAKFAPGGGRAAGARPPQQSTVDRTLDRSLDRSIDKSIDLAGLGDVAGDASDPIEAPIRKLVLVMLTEAARNHASEVRLTPLPDRVTTHYRIGDRLIERDRIPLKMRRPLFRIIREMAALGAIAVNVNGIEASWQLRDEPADAGECLVLTRIRDTVQSVLATQFADGFFASEPDLIGSGEQLRHFESALVAELGSMPQPPVIATIAVLIRLRARHRDQADLWQRADRKAVRWLAGATGRPVADVDGWLDKLATDAGLAATTAVAAVP